MANYTSSCPHPIPHLAHLAREEHQAGVRVIAGQQSGGSHVKAQHRRGTTRQGISCIQQQLALTSAARGQGQKHVLRAGEVWSGQSPKATLTLSGLRNLRASRHRRNKSSPQNWPSWGSRVPTHCSLPPSSSPVPAASQVRTSPIILLVILCSIRAGQLPGLSTKS